MERLTVNFVGKTRLETLLGREYLVAPMVMITEGVHNGSGGAYYYSDKELAKSPAVWDHKPIVINHPAEGSACSPSFLETNAVGMILNTSYNRKKKERGKLRAEAWLEVSRLKAVDERVLTRMTNNTVQEVSTGLFFDPKQEKGQFNGKKYIGVVNNIRPDHLAILPDEPGACSVADGAGLLQTNQANLDEPTMHRAIANAIETVRNRSELVVNQMSYSNISSLLSAAIRVELGDALEPCSCCYIEDVYPEFFIYWYESKLYKREYTATETAVSLVGESTEVVRVTEYRTADGAFIGNDASLSKEEPVMAKKDIVDGLVKNGGWPEDRREFLMGLEESDLSRMTIAPAPAPETKPAPELNKASDAIQAAVVAGAGGAVVAPEAAPVMTNAQFLAAMPADMREQYEIGQITTNKLRSELIAKITTEAPNVYTNAELTAMHPLDLQKLAEVIDRAKPAPQLNAEQARYAHFMGAGQPGGVTPVNNRLTGAGSGLALPGIDALVGKK